MRMMIFKRIALLGVLAAGICGIAQAQTKITDNAGAVRQAKPDALLELESNKGFLLPRMNTAQRNAITNPANPGGVPDTGTVVYNTDEDCLDAYVGPSTGWESMCATPRRPLIKEIVLNNQTLYLPPTPEVDYIMCVPTTAQYVLYLPDASSPNPPPIGKLVYISNVGKSLMAISPGMRNGAFGSIEPWDSGLVVYIGGSGAGSWDWVTGS